MIVLKILLIAIAVIAALLVIAYFVQPALLTFPYTWFVSLFVKNPPFVDVYEYFPNARKLEAHFEDIRAELEEVLKEEEKVPKFHEVDGIQRFISARDEVPWRTFIIKAYGKWIESNAERVPKTAALLREMPEVTTAMFSILEGGKHIPPHMGFYRGVWRYHLALIVPDDAPCYIIVGGQKYQWKEGESVLFDDTYMHEVWNKSQKKRVVLFCDVFREKSLPKWLRPLNRWLYNLLANSKRLQRAAKRAEVPKNVEPRKPEGSPVEA